MYLEALSRKLWKTTAGSKYALLAVDGLDLPGPPLELGSASFSARNGPEEPRFLLRPVRLGTVTLSSKLVVVTGVETRRLAKGSSGRSDAETNSGSCAPVSLSGSGRGLDRSA